MTEDSSTTPAAQPPSSSPIPASALTSSVPPGTDLSGSSPSASPANAAPPNSTTTQEKRKRSRKRGNPGKFQAEFAVLHGDNEATLTPEQRAELETRRDEVLTQTVKDGQKELLNWVHRQVQTSSHKDKGKAFVAISNQMTKVTRGAPRRKPDYKHFMSHPDYKSEFQAYYDEKTEGNPPKKSERMAVQCRLARELYEEQSDDVKTQIALENAESYSERFAAFKKLLSGQGFSLEGVDQLTDAEKALCRAGLTQFIQPLLDAIRAHTGLFLTLFIGGPPETSNGNDQFTLGM
ncbi:hypothetical protein F5878DRAFT_665989 [Lentinula raphanica]|uniref:Uncharacterized protein n=1 Tax=Lentinula raphanica TaxID=153919 RepID=A0AA38NYN1_9AGAR|nr:hypothetical protein F5878DRAFT_665989 [Lentinula raphanica]